MRLNNGEICAAAFHLAFEETVWPERLTQWLAIAALGIGPVGLAFYAWDEDEHAYLPFALNVLTFRGRLISDVVAFVARTIDLPPDHSYARWVDEEVDPARLNASFERFGMPPRLED